MFQILAQSCHRIAITPLALRCLRLLPKDDSHLFCLHRSIYPSKGHDNALLAEQYKTRSMPLGIGPGKAERDRGGGSRGRAGARRGDRSRGRRLSPRGLRGPGPGEARERSARTEPPCPGHHAPLIRGAVSLCVLPAAVSLRRSEGWFWRKESGGVGAWWIPRKNSRSAGWALTREIWQVPLSLGFHFFSLPLLFKLSHC